MNNITEPLVTIAAGFITVAIIAVLVSKNSQTPSVFQAAGSAFSNALGVAVSPVSGGAAFTPNVSYPSTGQFSGLAALPNLG